MTACIRPDAAMPAGAMSRSAPVADLAAYERWPELLADVDAVVHLAARVHVMRDRSADPLSEFRKVNVHAAAALAAQAARAGVRRFLYVSSIKVNGEATPVGEFHADDPPGYVDPYGQSKWEAEQSLEEVAAAAGMDWLVVRPTLVYGPGVQGNFLAFYAASIAAFHCRLAGCGTGEASSACTTWWISWLVRSTIPPRRGRDFSSRTRKMCRSASWSFAWHLPSIAHPVCSCPDLSSVPFGQAAAPGRRRATAVRVSCRQHG